MTWICRLAVCVCGPVALLVAITVLKSTIQHLGTQDFARLRIGIGAPGQNPSERKARTVSHVLGSFSRDEELLLEKVLLEVVDGLERIQRQGLDLAGNHINGLQLAPTSTEA